MSLQKYKLAYDAYQQAVFRDGRNPTFWCSIGVLYYQINQYRDALDAYSRAIRLDPYLSEVWYDLGTLYESCSQVTDALDAYQRASELDSGNKHIQHRLAMLKSQASSIKKPETQTLTPILSLSVPTEQLQRPQLQQSPQLQTPLQFQQGGNFHVPIQPKSGMSLNFQQPVKMPSNNHPVLNTQPRMNNPLPQAPLQNMRRPYPMNPTMSPTFNTSFNQQNFNPSYMPTSNFQKPKPMSFQPNQMNPSMNFNSPHVNMGSSSLNSPMQNLKENEMSKKRSFNMDSNQSAFQNTMAMGGSGAPPEKKQKQDIEIETIPSDEEDKDQDSTPVHQLPPLTITEKKQDSQNESKSEEETKLAPIQEFK
jgi:hypothetical protein